MGERRRSVLRAVVGVLAGAGLVGLWLREVARLTHSDDSVLLARFAIATVIGVVCLRSEALFAQVVGRGILGAQCLLAALAAVIGARLEPVPTVVLSLVALLPARDPWLRSPGALATFHPVAYRRTFLAVATMQAGLTSLVAIVGAELARRGHDAGPLYAAITITITALLGAAIAGLLAMRTWGVLLSAGLGVAFVAATLVSGALRASGWTDVGVSPRGMLTLCVLALVPLSILVPVVLARLGPPRPQVSVVTTAR